MPRPEPQRPRIGDQLHARITQELQRLAITPAELQRFGIPEDNAARVRIVHHRMQAVFGTDAGSFASLLGELTVKERIHRLKAIRLAQVSYALELPWHPLLPTPPTSKRTRARKATSVQLGEALSDAIAAQLTMLPLAPEEYAWGDSWSSPRRGATVEAVLHPRMDAAFGEDEVDASSTLARKLTPSGISKLSAITLAQIAIALRTPPHPLLPLPVPAQSPYEDAVLALSPSWAPHPDVWDNQVYAVIDEVKAARAIQDPRVALRFWTIRSRSIEDHIRQAEAEVETDADALTGLTRRKRGGRFPGTRASG